MAATGARAQNVGTGLQPEPDQSATRVGTRGAAFLEIPVGARAQALGGSGTGLIGGVEAMAWNVAAIAEVEAFSVGWAYSQIFADADIWVGLDLGALFRTGLLGVTLGAAIQNIGGEASYSGSGIEQIIGAAQDVFPSEDNIPIRFDTNELALPTLLRFSVVFSVAGTPEALFPTVPADHDVRLVADFFDAIDTALEPSVGFEYGFRNIVFGRAGKRFFNEDRADFRDFSDGLSFGGGIRVPVLGRYLGIDYAYTDMGLLDNVQTLSIQLGS